MGWGFYYSYSRDYTQIAIRIAKAIKISIANPSLSREGRVRYRLQINRLPSRSNRNKTASFRRVTTYRACVSCQSKTHTEKQTLFSLTLLSSSHSAPERPLHVWLFTTCTKMDFTQTFTLGPTIE